MDEEVQDILTRMEQYKDTHPNLSILWKTYLEEKVRRTKIAIQECKIALSQIQELNDLTPENIILLYCMGNLESQ